MATKTAAKAKPAKASEPAVEIIAFKGTDKDGKCRGYQYEVGKTYEHTGGVVACSSGFHSCENPFDVWSYYGLRDDNRFFRVRAGGKIDRHDSDSKIASATLTIEAELKLPDFVEAAVKWVMDATKGKGAKGDVDDAQIGSSGYGARIGSSGYGAQIDASGERATIAVAGLRATAKAGPDGAICLAYWDGKRTRFATGYVGEDGIKADTFYRAENGKLVAA